MEAYHDLEDKTRPGVRIAMRSSAVGEDSEASFAGQYITELNVTRDNLLEAYKAVVASKYSPRAILYRLRFGFTDEDTPMCVAGIEMIDAQASGVLYTVDPAHPTSGEMKISSIFGLGEHLVSGEASPDDYFVDRNTFNILRSDIRPKISRLVPAKENNVHLEQIPEQEGLTPSIDETTAATLARHGKTLEDHFQCPQDIEWALDAAHQLFFLQSRPLGVIKNTGEETDLTETFSKLAIRLQGGRTACPGIAAGKVFLAEGGNLASFPEGAILVAKTASPDYAEFVGKAGGIITDIGSVASHLASVAREFRVPALFDTGNATRLLKNGEEITLTSRQGIVYAGIPVGLTEKIKNEGRFVLSSPTHKRLRAALDLISPLNLTDPNGADFSPDGCRTIHDIVRFAHERIMKEVFFLSEKTDGALSVRLQANIPLVLYCIDLGGGLKENLTTCDEVNFNHITSIPLKSIWNGFMHPAITWAGTINLDMNNLLTIMSSTAVSEFGPTPGGDSYAVISRDYMNLSAKFAYHYANVDVFCAEEEENAGQNHILMQFSGGVGSFVGRSLRIQFLASVLGRLGFTLTITGDLLEASLKGAGRKVMEETLDQVGRLLASSRLLDMAIADQAQVETMTDAFFQGNYDFLNQTVETTLPDFYTASGNWHLEENNKEGMVLVQDGSGWLTRIGTGFAGLMGKVAGANYQEFLDNVGAYYHFPLAIAKKGTVANAVLSAEIRTMGGRIDQAGGLAFGLRNVGNYFVLRVNTLENNLILFEFVNNRRYERAASSVEIETGQWYTLRAEISGNSLKGYLDDKLLIEHTADWPIHGHIGLWTKADSLTHFRHLTANEGPETPPWQLIQ
ncbi:MAG: pyruvate, phosphate dikinase, partial [Proteobacteria bacterium]|nr:pyruvate, phosphate dikinase [Pseudomonadota bacterium]